jgi:hypothetical protein
MWTQFWDMHSGGGTKEPPYDRIYIEAPMEEAKRVFYNRFGHNPERVSCTCCGEDYSIDENESFAQLTGFHRNCRNLATPRDPDTRLYLQVEDPEFKNHYYVEEGEQPPKGFEIDDPGYRRGPYLTVDEYVKREEVLVIRASEIKPEERVGEVPEQGYVWRD